jgi:hypothetical protein
VRLMILLILIMLVAVSACRPPAVAPSPAGEVGQPRAAASSVRLPEPAVYVLRRINGLPLPADLKPPDYDPRRGSNFFKRVIAGRLYLTPDGDYQTVICSELVDSAGLASNESSGEGGKGNKYWAAGGRIYFSNPIADGGLDSTAVQVRPDTVEYYDKLFTRDRASVLPQFPVIVEIVCRGIRASLERGHPGAE